MILEWFKTFYPLPKWPGLLLICVFEEVGGDVSRPDRGGARRALR